MSGCDVTTQLFITACRAMALIRSFQGYREQEARRLEELEVTFEDFAITRTLFEPVFIASLHGGKESVLETRFVIERLARGKNRAPVSHRIR